MHLGLLFLDFLSSRNTVERIGLVVVNAVAAQLNIKQKIVTGGE